MNHLYLAASGINGSFGSVAREVALKIIEKFIIWRRTQSEIYYPETGIESMFDADEMEEMLKYLKSHGLRKGQSKESVIHALCKHHEKVSKRFPRPLSLFAKKEVVSNFTYFYPVCFLIGAGIGIGINFL